jgi:hypothetical protein
MSQVLKVTEKQMKDILNWVQDWYKNQCDGGWEHTYGVRITSLDNPGWQVEIDLADTKLKNLTIEYKLFEVSDRDWYGFKIDNQLFFGAGDPNKLSLILQTFKEIAEQYDKDSI